MPPIDHRVVDNEEELPPIDDVGSSVVPGEGGDVPAAMVMVPVKMAGTTMTTTKRRRMKAIRTSKVRARE